MIGVKGGGSGAPLNSLERNPKEREREDFRNRAVPMPTAVPDPAGIQCFSTTGCTGPSKNTNKPLV